MPLLAGFMVPHPPLIVPAVGRGGEAEIEETTKAYERVAEEIAALKPETIIITSPHSIMYADYFHISPRDSAKGSFISFGAPEVSFRETYDTNLVEAICDLAAESDFPAGTMGERDRHLDHGTMVPLWFIEKKYRDFKLVRTGLSGLPLTDHYKFGQMIAKAIEQTGRRTVIVASGDLSHKLQDYGPYGYAPEGPEYDKRIMDVMGRAAFGELLDFDETFCDKAAECGHRSFVIMAGAMDGRKVEAKVLSHQDVTGVGYGIGTFYPGEAYEERHFLDSYMAELKKKTEAMRASEDPYVSLARQSLETYIRTGRRISVPEGLPEEMLDTQAGAFVSIHKFGKLRGCIGTIEGVRDSVAEEIINNAISASTEDPRFSPITEDELKWLEINVDVLGEAEYIYSMDQLDVKRYGVIVSKGYRRGLLLPDLDGVDTPEQQVAIAKQKAGIRPDEEVKLQRFEVIRHR
ncbi:MAG: AmmeMemoRadiSam system protein A [Firmicutes bacterium]|nr:AmmeMemoRadiSam system protein A [Bacillota bacterium]MBR3375371.1 AmmeMemoRadiSam system protein A [Bacillota bacterium]